MSIHAAHLINVRNLNKTPIAQFPGYIQGRHVAAVLHAGGPAPASNAAIAGAVRAAIASGYQVLGFEDGFKGARRGDALLLTGDVISGIETQGGVDIGSSRYNPNEAERSEIIENFKKWGIEWLVAIGGDDTNTTAMRIARSGIFHVAGVPKTIDNDVTGTIETYGHETAVHYTSMLMKALKKDGQQADGPSFFLAEVMGRKSGSWALKASRAAGATFTLIPEMFTAEGIRQILKGEFPDRQGMNLKLDLLNMLSRMLEVRGRVLDYNAFIREIKEGGLDDGDLKINAILLAREIARVILDRIKAKREYGVIVVPEGIADKLPTRVAEKDEKGLPRKYEVVGLSPIRRKSVEKIFPEGDGAWNALFEDPSAMVLAFKSGLSEMDIIRATLGIGDDGRILKTRPEEVLMQNRVMDLFRERVIIGIDEHSNPRLSDIGIGQRLLPLISKATTELLAAEGLNKKCKLVAEKFGYPFRCLDPLAFDINLATSFGQKAVELLVTGKPGRMVVLSPQGTVDSVPYDELPKDENDHLMPRPVDLSTTEYVQLITQQDGKRNPIHPRYVGQ